MHKYPSFQSVCVPYGIKRHLLPSPSSNSRRRRDKEGAKRKGDLTAIPDDRQPLTSLPLWTYANPLTSESQTCQYLFEYAKLISPEKCYTQLSPASACVCLNILSHPLIDSITRWAPNIQTQSLGSLLKFRACTIHRNEVMAHK